MLGVYEGFFSLCGWERFILSPVREKSESDFQYSSSARKRREGERNISRHRCAFWRGGVDVYFVLFLLSLGRNCIFNCDWVAKNSGGVERASG